MLGHHGLSMLGLSLLASCSIPPSPLSVPFQSVCHLSEQGDDVTSPSLDGSRMIIPSLYDLVTDPW